MRKIFCFLLIGSVLFISSLSRACMGPQGVLVLQNISIDIDALRSLCDQQNCVIDDDEKEIVILSSYDYRVGVKINSGSIALEIPKKGSAFVIDPYEFDWNESLKVEFDFLEKNYLLNIKADDKEEILSAVKGSGKIVFYENEWQDIGTNCFVDDSGKKSCMRGCGGGAGISEFPSQSLNGK